VLRQLLHVLILETVAGEVEFGCATLHGVWSHFEMLQVRRELIMRLLNTSSVNDAVM
jgi:hypothetical protein